MAAGQGLMHGRDPHAAHIVRVRRADGSIVGSGLRVAGRRVITCAHVVEEAVEGEVRPGAPVAIELPLLDDRQRIANVVSCNVGAADSADDLAVLEIDASDALPDPPGLRTLTWRTRRPVRAFGFPHGHDDGVWTHGLMDAQRGDGTIQTAGLDATVVKIRPGFSGAPVWSEDTGALVGIVTGHDTARNTLVAFVIPVDCLPLPVEEASPIATLTEGLEGRPRAVGAKVERFLSSYLGTPGASVAFGGRARELKALDHWLASASQRALMVQPTGSGKSALATRWVASLAGRAQVAFLPVSIRYDTALRADAFAVLGARLGLLGPTLADRRDADEWLVTIDATLRADRAPDQLPLVVVIDGVDEAIDWSIGTDLPIPLTLGAGVKVLITGRPIAARGEREWEQAIGWRPGQVTRLELPLLDRDAVHDVVSAARPASPQLRGLSHELARVSEGDPLLLSLYLAALADDPDPDLEALQRLDPGLNALLDRWLDELRRLVPDTEALRGVHALLHLLASALGPLARADLLTIAGRALDPALLDVALHEARRLVIGDGREQGYALTHPRLAEQFREHRMSEDERRAWDTRFTDAGAAVLDALEDGADPSSASSYMIEHLGAHLALAPDGYATAPRLVGTAWLAAWRVHTGTYDGFLDDVARVQRDALARDDHEQALRCVLVRGRVIELVCNIPGTAFHRWVAEGRMTYAQALSHVRLMDRERWRGDALAAVACLATDDQLAETELLARQIVQRDDQVIVLAALARRADRPELFREAIAIASELRLDDQWHVMVELIHDAPVDCPPLDRLVDEFVRGCRAMAVERKRAASHWLDEAERAEEAQAARRRGESPPADRWARAAAERKLDTSWGLGDDLGLVQLVANVLHALPPRQRLPLAPLARRLVSPQRHSSDTYIVGLLWPPSPGPERAAALDEELVLQAQHVRQWEVVDCTRALLDLALDEQERRLIAETVWQARKDERLDQHVALRLMAEVAPMLGAADQRAIVEHVEADRAPTESEDHRQDVERARARALARVAEAASGAVRNRAWRALLVSAARDPATHTSAIAAVFDAIPTAPRSELRAALRTSALGQDAYLLTQLAERAPASWLDDLSERVLTLPATPAAVGALLAVFNRTREEELRVRAVDFTAEVQDAIAWSACERVDPLLRAAWVVEGEQQRELLVAALALSREAARLGLRDRIDLQRAVVTAVALGHTPLARATLDEVAGTFSFGPAALALAFELEGEERLRMQREALRGTLEVAGRAAAYDVWRDEGTFHVLRALATDEDFNSRELWEAFVASQYGWERFFTIHLLTWLVPLLNRLGGASLLHHAVTELVEVQEWISQGRVS